MTQVSLVASLPDLYSGGRLPEAYAKKDGDYSHMQDALFLKYVFDAEDGTDNAETVRLLLVNRSRYVEEGRSIIANSFTHVSVYDKDWDKGLVNLDTMDDAYRKRLVKNFFLVVPFIMGKYGWREKTITCQPAGINRFSARWWFSGVYPAGRMQWKRLRPMESFVFGQPVAPKDRWRTSRVLKNLRCNLQHLRLQDACFDNAIEEMPL